MLIAVRVIPRSRRNSVVWEAGELKVHLTAPPVDGAANEALVALLAKQFALPKRSITIVHGATGKKKMVEMVGITTEEVEKKLQ